jgi:cystathionine beta-lyase family protein involved in aluminum resistance
LSFADFERFGISHRVFDLSEQARTAVQPAFTALDQIREQNQLRVIAALQQARLQESMLGGSTGYGYGDLGREQVEQAFAGAFSAEAALVRVQISSGTQALALCLFGLLRPGGELLSVTGRPYDSLCQTIGGPLSLATGDGSLHDFGIGYRQVDLTPEGSPDLAAIRAALGPQTTLVFIQKSRGYTLRRALRNTDIAAICQAVRESGSRAKILVDNCYGEFVESSEPCMAGADLCAGSLIKNPGGGICPSGGYVAGDKTSVARVAARLNAPGLEGHVGPSLGFSRLLAQGLYLAPHIVSESLRGAVFTAALFSLAGFAAQPGPFDPRGDIVQSLTLGTPEKLVAFCQSIQAASPVDSFVRPEPWDMPGYDCPVIMAAGTFVQGASIELSADGPLRPPYAAYLQGGLCFENVRLAAMLALEKMGAAA